MALLDLTVNRQNFNLYCGDDFVFLFRVKDDATGVAISLTGWTVTMDLRNNKTNTLVQRLAIGSGFVTTGSVGELKGVVLGTNTQALNCSELIYDIQVTNTDAITVTYLSGLFKLIKDSTVL